MNKALGLFFAFFCIATAALSNNIMGAGFWFWVILTTGIMVAISQFTHAFRIIGAGLAALLSIISVGAILLILVAATIGGSFHLEEKEAMLLVCFFMTALVGITLAATCKRPKPVLQTPSEH